MKLLFISYFLVTVGIDCAFLHRSKRDDFYPINNAVINILKSCFRNDIHTVGLINPSDDLVSAISSEMELFIDFLIIEHKELKEEIEEEEKEEIQPIGLPIKLRHIIVPWLNTIHPYFVIQFVRDWLHDDFGAVKFVIPVNIPRNGCELFDKITEHYYKFLRSNTSDFIVVCMDDNENVSLRAVNQYNEKVPESWMPVKNIFSYGYIRGLVLTRTFDKNLTCDSLFFEKTSTLDYYPFRMQVKSVPQWMLIDIDESTISLSKSKKTRTRRILVTPDKWNIFKGLDGMVMRTLFTFLNATAVIQIYTKSVTRTSIGKRKDAVLDKNLNPFEKKVIELNSHDVLPNLRGIPRTYPFLHREIVIVINDRANVHKPARFFAFFNTETVISIVIVFLLLVHVLGRLSRQGFGPAALNTLRFLLGIHIQSMPTGLPFRIFLASLIPYSLILIITFLSYLFYIRTSVPRTEMNVDSLDDLHGFNIYTRHLFDPYLELFQNGNYHFKKNYGTHCTEMVLMDSHAACIDDLIHVKHAVENNHRLRRIKQPLTTIFKSYSTSMEYPLLNRINILLLRLKESGLIDMWYEQSFGIKTSFTENERTSMAFKAITLDECASIFLVLLAGLAISTVVFVIELLIGPMRKIYHLINSNKMNLFRGCH